MKPFHTLLLSSLLLPAFAIAQDDAPATAADAAEPVKAIISTTMGDIAIEVYPDRTPKTVENFLQYVNSGFYEGTVFHRVIENFMVQGGGLTADLREKPRNAPSVANEGKSCIGNARGTVAMARTADPHSASSQFFINVVDNPRLDYSASQGPVNWGYCAFGKVTSGMDVVDRIRAVKTGAKPPFTADVPLETITIEKITLVD